MLIVKRLSMKRVFAFFILLPILISQGGCSCSFRPGDCGSTDHSVPDDCLPSLHVPSGPWKSFLPHGPWDKKCSGIIEDEAITRIVLAYSRELKTKYKLKLHDAVTYYSDEVGMYKLRLDFTTMQIVELCEARFLLVDIVEGFLSRINNNILLRGDLSHRPFSPMNLEIHVTFESFYVLHVDPMYIGFIILEEGTSFFYNAELDDRLSEYWHKRIEPYHKTLQIVNIERQLGPDPQEKDKFDQTVDKYFDESPDVIVN